MADYILRYRHESDEWQELPLTDGEHVIGRGSGSAVQLKYREVSRFHAKLALQGGTLSITDLGSANGTHLAGTRLAANQPVTFQPDQEITIGHCTLVVVIDKPEVVPSIVQPTAEPARAEAPLPEAPPPVYKAELEAEVQLRFQTGGQWQFLPVQKKEVVIGRSGDCDIVLSEPGISRRHAAFRTDGDNWLVLDLGSTNGTQLEGRP